MALRLRALSADDRGMIDRLPHAQIAPGRLARRARFFALAAQEAGRSADRARFSLCSYRQRIISLTVSAEGQ